MATQTSNLGLTKPAGTDFVQVNDFNGNSDIVDRSIGKLSELRTNVKSSLVEAINEAMISGGTDSPYINKTNGHWMQWNNTLLKFEDTGIVASGSMWYNGTKITGTSAAPSVFETDISLAHVGDLYLNIQSANVYWCAKEGNASTATWRYLCNIRGLTGDTGPIGPTGTTFTPSVNSQTGIISWSNDGGKTNPPSVNIKGPKGDPGVGLDIRGTYATLSDLQSAITSPQQGWMYNVGTAAPYRVYMYDSSAGWLDQGQLQGPTGSTGKSAYVAAVEGGYVGNEETFNVQMAEMPTHITNTNNPHRVNKSQIGLNKVDNTSDLEKPISKAQSAVNQQVATDLQDKQPLLTPGDNISITDRIITTKAFPCNPNLLDNWYFGNPVNQRDGHIAFQNTTTYTDAACTNVFGVVQEVCVSLNRAPTGNYYFTGDDGRAYYVKASDAFRGYTGVGYTVDRWRIGDGSNGTLSLNESGLKITRADAVMYLEQRIPKTQIPEGIALTYSVLTTSGLFSISFVVKNDTYHAQDVGGGISLGWNYTPAEFMPLTLVNNTVNSNVTVKAVKLELGSEQTLAHQENGEWVLNEIPKFGDQLAECQRYALNMIQDDTKYTPMGIGVARSATVIQGKISIPVQMRALPAISTNAADWVIVNGGNYLNPTTFSLDGISPALVNITFSGQGFSTGVAYEIFVNPGGKCILSADL